MLLEYLSTKAVDKPVKKVSGSEGLHAALRFDQNLTKKYIPSKYSKLDKLSGVQVQFDDCHKSAMNTIRHLCIKFEIQIEENSLTY